MHLKNETQYSSYSDKFQALVIWVDHNSTIGDKQKKGTVENISPKTGRNYRIGVIKLHGNGYGASLDVIVPMSVLGEFRLPQLGDIVWIEESRRGPVGEPTRYLYSTYNSVASPNQIVGQTPPPQWGSRAGDRGEIISYRDHVKQFVPTINSNFVKKFVKSITGHRFRQFYRSNLVQGRFVVRGDSVFDIDDSISRKYLVEDGAYIGYGGSLEDDKGIYPNPLNVPKEKEEDEDYKYYKIVHRVIDEEISGNQYDIESTFSYKPAEVEEHTLKNKNFMSYQPVLDKTYLEYAEFERELPAAEEYQVTLRGNNKLLIQDQYGDGEQLLITLKNQYDAGFTVIHNAEKGQVRIRDHMGQGVLLEADPEAPRVISWTANRQVIEQGATANGEFTYIRNGSIFGDSDTSFGTKTGLTKGEVPNQEFLMVSTPDIIGDLSSRLSGGMMALASSGASAGVYIRNNVDPETTNQGWAMYKNGSALTVKIEQENAGVEGAVQNSLFSQTLDGTAATQTTSLVHTAEGTPHDYNEIISATDSDVTKSSVMTRASGEVITYSEAITGPNAASSSKNITLPNGNIISVSEDATAATVTSTVIFGEGTHTITRTENATAPSVVINVQDSGNNVANYAMSTPSIVTTKYNAGGVAVSTVTQDVSGQIDVQRSGPGLAMPINIGTSGTGAITIGNPAGNTTIAGLTTSVTGATAANITAPAVNIVDPS